MRIDDYRIHLDKISCSDEFRNKMEELLSAESDGTYADSVNTVERADRINFQRWSGLAASAVLLVGIGGLVLQTTRGNNEINPSIDDESQNPVVSTDILDDEEAEYSFYFENNYCYRQAISVEGYLPDELSKEILERIESSISEPLEVDEIILSSDVDIKDTANNIEVDNPKYDSRQFAYDSVLNQTCYNYLITICSSSDDDLLYKVNDSNGIYIADNGEEMLYQGDENLYRDINKIIAENVFKYNWQIGDPKYSEQFGEIVKKYRDEIEVDYKRYNIHEGQYLFDTTSPITMYMDRYQTVYVYYPISKDDEMPVPYQVPLGFVNEVCELMDITLEMDEITTEHTEETTTGTSEATTEANDTEETTSEETTTDTTADESKTTSKVTSTSAGTSEITNTASKITSKTTSKTTTKKTTKTTKTTAKTTKTTKTTTKTTTTAPIGPAIDAPLNNKLVEIYKAPGFKVYDQMEYYSGKDEYGLYIGPASENKGEDLLKLLAAYKWTPVEDADGISGDFIVIEQHQTENISNMHISKDGELYDQSEGILYRVENQDTAPIRNLYTEIINSDDIVSLKHRVRTRSEYFRNFESDVSIFYDPMDETGENKPVDCSGKMYLKLVDNYGSKDSYSDVYYTLNGKEDSYSGEMYKKNHYWAAVEKNGSIVKGFYNGNDDIADYNLFTRDNYIASGGYDDNEYINIDYDRVHAEAEEYIEFDRKYKEQAINGYVEVYYYEHSKIGGIDYINTKFRYLDKPYDEIVELKINDKGVVVQMQKRAVKGNEIYEYFNYSLGGYAGGDMVYDSSDFAFPQPSDELMEEFGIIN